MQVNVTHNDDRPLCSVLHAIATHPESAPCVLLVLETAMDLTGASGAAFRSFGEAQIAHAIGVITSGELATSDYEALAESANAAANDAPASQMIFAVHVGDTLRGALALEFATPRQLEGVEHEALNLLSDALAIVVARAEMQAEAERSRRLAQSAIDSMVDPLLVFDAEGLLITANAPALALFGDSASAGNTLAEVSQSDELVAFTKGERALHEWSFGDKVFVPRTQMIRDAGHTPEGLILTLHDITQFKKLNHNQNEFIRLVSHDIRSPLTSVQGFASMLEMVGDLNDKQGLFVEKVLSGITTITALVDNIQDAGRFDPETGFYEMTRSHTDLREIVNRIVNNHLLPAEKQDLSISVNVGDDVPILNVDSNMLERALTNLVDNAIKYTPNGGKISVNVGCKNESVIIGVRDSGYGISAENQKQLFQRHVRLARHEHRRVKGSGLGLFIVKSVAQRHGGDAWVASGENQGSTFFLSIPLSGANLVIPGED